MKACIMSWRGVGKGWLAKLGEEESRACSSESEFEISSRRKEVEGLTEEERWCHR